MKYLKLYLSIFILFFSLTNTFSQDCLDPEDCLPTPGTGGGDGSANTGGPGSIKVPIDDYAPILIVLGITVAGVVVFRKKLKQIN